jgi:hypothetical protein
MYSHNSTFKSKTFKKLAVLAGIACLSLTLSTTLWAKDDDDNDKDDDRKKDGDSLQVANIVDFVSGDEVAGAATLTRTKKSVTAGIFTTGLDESAAYTMWWIVWNDPSACMGGCGEDDLNIAGNSILYAGGFVTGADGSANVTVQLKAGTVNKGIEVFAGKGLDKKKAFEAEIHLIIRSHGKIMPKMVDLQIGTFDGGCSMVPDPCHDHQAVAFLP